MQYPIDRLHALRRLLQSLPSPDDIASASVADFLEDGPVSLDFIGPVELGIYIEKVRDAIPFLEWSERQVIELRFGPREGGTLEEIGRQLGMTRDQVLAIETEALRKMKRRWRGQKHA